MGGYGVQAGGHFVALPLPIYNPIPPTKSTSFCYAIAGLHSGLHFTLQLHSNVSGPRVHAVKKKQRQMAGAQGASIDPKCCSILVC